MSDKSLSCKVVLLGESGVGKTCIISRFVNNTYDERSETTNGASYASKVVEFERYGKSLRLDIWDTAGQECYRSLNKIFYRDAKIVILVYDITNRKTFEDLKYYWYRQVESSCEKNPIIGIAGNKCDMFDKEAVTEDEAKAFATEIGAQFQLTSAFKNNGIEELFKLVGCKYLDPNFQQKVKENPSTTADKNIKLTNNKDKPGKKKGRC